MDKLGGGRKYFSDLRGGKVDLGFCCVMVE